MVERQTVDSLSSSMKPFSMSFPYSWPMSPPEKSNDPDNVAVLSNVPSAKK
jgi:hypothetical protein